MWEGMGRKKAPSIAFARTNTRMNLVLFSIIFIKNASRSERRHEVAYPLSSPRIIHLPKLAPNEWLPRLQRVGPSASLDEYGTNLF